MIRMMQGTWNNGLLNGKGTIRYYDLLKQKWLNGFEGTFKNGEKCGFGVEHDLNSTYRGEFEKGCRTGRGRL